MIWGELFGGGGGVGTGLAMAGAHASWSIEIDQDAARTYQRNHPETHVIHADVRDVDPKSLPPVQGIWLSPVCKQDSKARLSGLPPREDASIGLAAIPFIEHLKPELVILENVARYQDNPAYKEIFRVLVKMGYAIEVRVLNAADYGVPQFRERLILQARRGPIAWPDKEPKHGWYAAMEDLIPSMQRIELALWQKKLWEPRYNEMIPLMVHGHYHYKHKASDARMLDILPANAPGRAVTTSHNVLQRYIVLPDRVLKPSIQAIARLQTFPDSYEWPEIASRAVNVIGNAVPCALVQRLVAPYVAVEAERAVCHV
jgi:DNA (cytosine-5)-methyltransferase 1